MFVKSARRKAGSDFVTLISLLVTVLVTVILFSLATGAVRVSPGAILAALFGDHPSDSDPANYSVADSVATNVWRQAWLARLWRSPGLCSRGFSAIRWPILMSSARRAERCLAHASASSFFRNFHCLVSAPRRFWLLQVPWQRWCLSIGWRDTNGRTNVVTLLLAGFAVSTMLGYSSYFFEAFDSGSGIEPS